MAHLEEFVHRDERLPMLLDRLRENGVKTFLLTNSEFWYTEAIMTYLLNFDGVSERRGGRGTGTGTGTGTYVGRAKIGDGMKRELKYIEVRRCSGCCCLYVCM